MNDHRIDKLNIEIRKVSDQISILKLISEIAKDMSEHGLHHWSEYYTKEIIEQKLEHGEFFGAYNVSNKLIGIIHLSTVCPTYYIANEDGLEGKSLDYTQEFSDPTAIAIYISALGVHPSSQGQGIAQELIKLAESRARQSGVRFCRLDARKSGYEKLPKFYEWLGYITKTEMIDEGDTYVLMEKEII